MVDTRTVMAALSVTTTLSVLQEKGDYYGTVN